MLRQIANLRRFGRLRTNSPTPRFGKPKILCDNPDWELTNLLDFVTAYHGNNDDFFFVQIGAYDGVSDDPIFHLVKQHGWQGILVEPQLEAFELLQKNYAQQEGLQFFNLAIGTEDGEATFYTRSDGMVQAASLIKQLMVKPGRKRRHPEGRRVSVWTLERLLREAKAPPRIDLLQIDAEGFDYQIIRSIDFKTIRPSIIRYEHMVLSQSDRKACIELLASEGYRFLLEDADTTAYIEDPTLSTS